MIIIPHHSPGFVITTYNSIDGEILTQSVYLASKHEYESINLPMHNNINAHVLVAYDSMLKAVEPNAIQNPQIKPHQQI